MIAVQVQFSGTSDVAQVVNAIGRELTNPTGLLEVIGRSVVKTTKAWYRELDSSYPNKMGGRRRHFWRGVADTVNNPVVGPAIVTVRIAHPVIAHKAGLGPAKGIIVPKEKKWLAFPVIREAYGMSPREYERGGAADRELRFVKFSDVSAALFEALSVRGPKGGRIWRVAFALRKSVRQAPFPKALPTEQAITDPLASVVSGYLQQVAMLKQP